MYICNASIYSLIGITSHIEFENGPNEQPLAKVEPPSIRYIRNVSPCSLVKDPLLRIEFESEPDEKPSVKIELPV